MGERYYNLADAETREVIVRKARVRLTGMARRILHPDTSVDELLALRLPAVAGKEPPRRELVTWEEFELIVERLAQAALDEAVANRHAK